jgi:hypothetical protein
MDDMNVVAPADAFRLLLRSHYPAKPTLPDEIQSYGWFHRAYNRSDECTQADVETALDALKSLKENVRSYSIRLRGVLKDQRPSMPPAFIDPAEQSLGELDVFAQTLACRTRTYLDVFCVKADVVRLLRADQDVESKIAKETRRRGPKAGEIARYADKDRALFPELERIIRDECKTRSAAASALADRIAGAGTPESKAKRLAALYAKERLETR